MNNCTHEVQVIVKLLIDEVAHFLDFSPVFGGPTGSKTLETLGPPEIVEKPEK